LSYGEQFEGVRWFVQGRRRAVTSLYRSSWYIKQ